MMRQKKKVISLLLCVGLLVSACPQTTLAKEKKETTAASKTQLAAGESVQVSTPEQFEAAMENDSVKEVVVTKRITLSGTAESSDYSISPVMISGNKTIKGNGSGILTLRSPIQLTGDNVTFQNIEMNFISSGALGSVPHREIFLAGHTLTLDNVNCYTKGSDGSLGGFGGNEAELLPTVYAGGYRNTDVRDNGAALTIINSNDKTNIQGIYAGHDKGKDNKVPYTGDMKIEIDSRAAVRDGIFASANKAEVQVTVKGNNQDSCRTKYFEGNERTTFTFDNVAVNRIPVNGGNIKLENGAIFEPVAKAEARLQSVKMVEGTVLNLVSMPGAVIEGAFSGGGGTLILDKDDMLTIKGELTGNTIFKTWGGSLATKGSLEDGKVYIQSTSGDGTIELDSSYGSNYKLENKDGKWTVKNETPADDRTLGSFEIVSAPDYVDYDVVAKDSIEGLEPSYLFVTETKDTNGDIYVPHLYPYVVRSEQLERPEDSYSDPYIYSQSLSDREGLVEPDENYYLEFAKDLGSGGISSLVQPGKYVLVFTTLDDEPATVKEILNAEVPGSSRAEFTIYKNSSASATPITKENISEIPNQKFTGREIKPEVTVTVDGKTLAEGTDYVLKYENNTEITTDAAKAKVIVQGIGNYGGDAAEKEFEIVKGETETTGVVSADRKDYTYGETVKLTFVAEPKKDVNKKRALRSAAADTADFYYGDELLGSAEVVNGKAVFFYDTTEKIIPVGSADVRVDFGGNDKLEKADFTTNAVFELQKRKLEPTDVASVSLKNFDYDGTKETEVTGIRWTDSSIETVEVTGTATLDSEDAGSYNEATVNLSFPKEWEDWNDTTPFVGKFKYTVSPSVVIRKAPNTGGISVPLKTYDGKAEHVGEQISFQDHIPAGYTLKNAYIDTDMSDYGSVIENVKVTQNNEVTFDVAAAQGTARIVVVLEFKNHENMNIVINILSTEKTVVDLKLTAPDKVYDGSSYDAWSLGEEFTGTKALTFYNVDEGKELGGTAPKDVGNYRMEVQYEDTATNQIGMATADFKITAKPVQLKALDQEITVGEAAPSLDHPQEGTHYEYISEKPTEDIGTIKMAYSETPDTGKPGEYKIEIGVIGNINENYAVQTQEGTLKIVRAPQKYDIKVNGGSADVEKAAKGTTVTITAEVPADKEFVAWTTANADVKLADARSKVTTFIMPEGDVELTAEFREKENNPGSGGDTGSGNGTDNGGGDTNPDNGTNNDGGDTNSDNGTNNDGGDTNSDNGTNNDRGDTNSDNGMNNDRGDTNSDNGTNNDGEDSGNTSNRDRRAADKGKEGVPVTGDRTPLVPWSVSLITSLGIILVLVRRLIKTKSVDVPKSIC